MKKEKNMSEQKIQDSRIKTASDMEKLLAFERGKYCVVLNHQHVMFNQDMFLTKQEAELGYHNLVKSLQAVFKNPNDPVEQKEAEQGLNTVRIEPFRVH